jgi:hypothetical protein
MVCYAVSFGMPVAFEAGDPSRHVPDETVYGFEAFMMSMFPGVSIYAGDMRFFVSWLANIAWVVGIWSYIESKREMSRLMGFAGVGLSSLHMTRPGIMFGYFVWVASMYLMLIGSLLPTRKQSSR